MAFVQQTKKHTDQLTGSQRKCSFVLMSFYFIKLFMIERMIFRTDSQWLVQTLVAQALEKEEADIIELLKNTAF